MNKKQCVSCLNQIADEELLCGICYDKWRQSCLNEKLAENFCAIKSDKLFAAVRAHLLGSNENNLILIEFLKTSNVLQCVEWQLVNRPMISPEVIEYLQTVLIDVYEKSTSSNQLFYCIIEHEQVSVLIARKSSVFFQKVKEARDDYWLTVNSCKKRHNSGLFFKQKLKRLKTELSVLLALIVLFLTVGFVMYASDNSIGGYLLIASGGLTVLVFFLWIARYSSFDLNLSIKPRVGYQLDQFFVPENYLTSLQNMYSRMDAIIKKSAN